MTDLIRMHILMLGVAAALWICNGQTSLTDVSLAPRLRRIKVQLDAPTSA